MEYKDRIRSFLTSDSSSYKGIPDEKHHTAEEIKALMPRPGDELYHLTHIWYVADYLLMPCLQNHVLEHLEVAQTKFHLAPPKIDVWRAAKGIPATCCGDVGK
jgi:hypothetical protein